MVQIMGLSGLRIICIFLLLISCNLKDKESFTYVKHQTGFSDPIDSINIVKNSDAYHFNGHSFIFHFDEKKGDSIQLSLDSCKNEPTINLKIGEIVDLECGSLYPFFGDRITVLDIKSFYIDKMEYKIYKFFNETGDSYLNSSVTYWLKKYGFILINVGGGKYYELKEINARLISLIKEDFDFSGLRPIPPAPPVPIFDEKD